MAIYNYNAGGDGRATTFKSWAIPGNNYMVEAQFGAYSFVYANTYSNPAESGMVLRHGKSINTISIDLSVRSTNMSNLDWFHYFYEVQTWYNAGSTMTDWPFGKTSTFSAPCLGDLK